MIGKKLYNAKNDNYESKEQPFGVTKTLNEG